MKRAFLIFAGATVLVAGCAQRPDAIQPITMSSAAYDRLTCQEASAELGKVSASLSAHSDQQNNAATGDALGVFLVGVPVSSLTGGGQGRRDCRRERREDRARCSTYVLQGHLTRGRGSDAPPATPNADLDDAAVRGRGPARTEAPSVYLLILAETFG